MSGDELRDDEPDIRVIRSDLDPNVWVCFPQEGSYDLSDFMHPGRLRSVQRYAVTMHANGRRVRWHRLDEDTWQMRFPPEADR